MSAAKDHSPKTTPFSQLPSRVWTGKRRVEGHFMERVKVCISEEAEKLLKKSRVKNRDCQSFQPQEKSTTKENRCIEKTGETHARGISPDGRCI